MDTQPPGHGSNTSPVEQVYLECERARFDGDLIAKVSEKDKEYHFQNWVQDRLDACRLDYDEPGRNTYPDFRLVNHSVGFEVKGLAWPGREADYDSNSQVPTGRHHGREVYYIFGRYPSSAPGLKEYPVADLVLCHGDFLNSSVDYIHKNKSFIGFGSYGDIRIRDRKMYVVPTPYALLRGTAGLSTLILPADRRVESSELLRVGEFERTEVAEVVVSYEFDLRTNDLKAHTASNPRAGTVHTFAAYRSRRHGSDKQVDLSTVAGK